MKKRVTLMAVVFFVGCLFFNLNNAFSADKPIELKLSHFVPPTHFIHAQILASWAKEAEKRTNGAIKIVIFPGQRGEKRQSIMIWPLTEFAILRGFVRIIHLAVFR